MKKNHKLFVVSAFLFISILSSSAQAFMCGRDARLIVRNELSKQSIWIKEVTIAPNKVELPPQKKLDRCGARKLTFTSIYYFNPETQKQERLEDCLQGTDYNGTVKVAIKPSLAGDKPRCEVEFNDTYANNKRRAANAVWFFLDVLDFTLSVLI